MKIGNALRDAAVAKDFADARALLPTASPWPVKYSKGATLDLHIAAPALVSARPKSVEFYPLDAAAIVIPLRSASVL